MNIKGILKAGMILMVLGFAMNIIGIARASDDTEYLVDDIEEYNGSDGPENALYGLKLAFENIDESFTWNATEKLGKQISHSRLRIAEAKTELKNNNNEAAEKAFENYNEKAKETEESISEIPGNDSGVLNAQKMIEKHQYVLEQLIGSHPNNTGLQNAYNRSQELIVKFEQKTEIKIERIRTGQGKNILREIKKEKKEEQKDDRNDQESKIISKISGNDSLIKTEEGTTKKWENQTESKEDRKENMTEEVTTEERENQTESKEDTIENKTEEVTTEKRESQTESKEDIREHKKVD